MTYEKIAEKVIKLLTKHGYGEESAKQLIEKNLKTAIQCYPEARPAYLANVVTM